MLKKILNEWGKFLQVSSPTTNIKHSTYSTHIHSILRVCIFNLTNLSNKSPESASVLGSHSQGWFSQHGQKDLLEVANTPLKTFHEKFEDVYICDPKAKHYGYKSWDGKSVLTTTKPNHLYTQHYYQLLSLTTPSHCHPESPCP